MGNIIISFLSGFTKVIGDLFGSPLDFLAGKSCSSVCASPWDFFCYIENFCVANLLKMVVVLALLYIVLLFFYLLYKTGICQCVGHSLCKTAWACLLAWFSMWGYCCIFMSDKLIVFKRVRHGHRSDSSGFDTSEEDFDHIPRTMEICGPLSRRTRDYRRVHLRKSLRPRSHRIQVGLGSDFDYGSGRIHNVKHGKHFSTIHSIRVTHTSQFVRKREVLGEGLIQDKGGEYLISRTQGTET